MTSLAALTLLAQAGSGSSGFGGGGGGGSSSFGGGSSGSGSGSGDPIVVVIVFGAVGLFMLYLFVHSIRYRRKVRERDERVRAASAEAAQDDAYLAAAEVDAHARGLFVACQQAWDARDRERLAQLVGPDLLVEWGRRLDDFESKGWHNRVSVREAPKIEYVGLVNREDDSEDRVVVRITAALNAYVVDRDGHKIMRKEAKSENITLCEYWTLARRGESWTVASIEQRAEGDHHLDAEIVASPWSDTAAPSRRGAHRAGGGRRPAAGLHHGRPGRAGVRGRRPRAGARPVAGRRALRPRRARGGGAARGGRLGRGGRRRRRRARGARHAGGRGGAAPRRRRLAAPPGSWFAGRA